MGDPATVAVLIFVGKVIVGAAIVTAVTISVIQAFQSPKPSKFSFGFAGDLGGSPTYGSFVLSNTVSNQLPIPVLYGKLKLGGNVIWQTDPRRDGGVDRIVGLCEGEIESITDVRANDVGFNELAGVNNTNFLGTGTQKADSRVTESLRPDLELHHLAYISMTLKSSEKLKGGNPTITSVVKGLKIETFSDGVWSTAKSYSRNPAACVRDLITNGRYGLGIKKSNIDEAGFGEIYDYCEELIHRSNAYQSDADTVLLLHMNGVDGSTTFTDDSSKAHSVTAKNGAEIDVTESQFGKASGFFDGVDDFLSIPNHSSFNFGTGDFTLECRIKFRTVPSGIVAFISYGGHVGFSLSKKANGNFSFFIGNIEVVEIEWNPKSDVWYHLMGVRSGGTASAFIDGIKGVDKASTFNVSRTGILAIGANTGEIQFHDGWIDEVRISDSARQTTSFAVLGPDEPRFRLDYILDVQRPVQDLLNDILSTFTGFMVYAGNKIKLRVEKAEAITQFFGDGSTTKNNAERDPGNIVKDSFAWNMSSIDDRPNRLRLQWVDPGQNYVKVYTQIEDRIDQDDRGTIIPKDISLLGITRQSQASRMVKLQMAIIKYANIQVSFSARLESIHCEIGDVVAVTHQSARFSQRLFRIMNIQESEDETIRFTCRDYIASLYDDRQATAIITTTQPPGPNLFAALEDVTNLTVREDNFKNKDGVFATNLLAEWTAIKDDELLRLDRYLIQLSSDSGATFRDVAFASSQKTSYRIVLGDVQTNVTFTVRVKTVSDRGAESAGVTASILTEGKQTPPSDVSDFDVNFSFDHIAMSWSAVDDADLFAYEIRSGNANSIWETATIITTEILNTRFDLFNFTRGEKKFFIKAIDNSGNYSENAAVDAINITNIPESNVVFDFDLWSRVTVFPHPLQGTLSSELDRVLASDFDPKYNRIAFQPKTEKTWLDLENDGGTWKDLQNSAFVYGLEDHVTSEESYETESIDIGVKTSGSYIMDIQTFSSSNLGFVSVEISTSDDDITFADFKPFVAGEYEARYVKFRFKIQATTASTKVRLVSAKITIDVPDVSQSFLNEAVSAGGRTFFLTGFTKVKSVVITTVGTSNLMPRIHDQSNLPNSFEMRMFDTGGTLAAGNVNIDVKGF